MSIFEPKKPSVQFHKTTDIGNTPSDLKFNFREDLPIVIKNSDCDNNCLCKSRQGGLTDECEIKSIKGQIFFVMVVTHKPHKNGIVIFSGMNLLNVTETVSDN